MDSQDLRNLSEAYGGIYDEGYIPWDFGPKDKAKAKFDQLAQRKAQEKTSGVRGGRGTATRANRIAAVARDMRTTLDKDSAATGTDPRRQGLQPSTARHTAAAQRGAGGGSTARKSYDVKPLRNRRGGGSSSLGGVGTASGTGRYTPGGGGRFGLAGTGLADSYFPDTFDIILEYLVAEGYADTNDNALVIMANMSEEWRDSIVYEVLDEGYKRFPYKKVANKLDKMYDDPDTDIRFGKDAKRYSTMKRVDSHMKGEVPRTDKREYSPKISKAKSKYNP